MKSLVQLLCIISGVRADALEKTPKAYSQAATIGALLLLTPTVSGITMAYAINRAFSGDAYAMPATVLGGLLWSTIVFAIERSLLLGIDKFASIQRQLLQIGFRAPLAIMVGLAVSKPVLLRVSQTVLDLELRKEEQRMIHDEAAQNAEGEELAQKVTATGNLRKQERDQTRLLEQKPNTFAYQNAEKNYNNADAQYRRALGRYNPMIENAQRALNQLPADSQSESQRKELQEQIAGWKNEINRVYSSMAEAKSTLNAVEEEWRTQQSEALRKIQHDLQNAIGREESATQIVQTKNQQSEQSIKHLLGPNLVNEYTRLKRIEADPKNPESGTLRTFEWGLDFAFIVLELTPIVIKVMGRRGPLDHAMLAAETEDRERAYVSANAVIARMQKTSSACASVEDKALDAWLETQLEQVEQTDPMTSVDLNKVFQTIGSIETP